MVEKQASINNSKNCWGFFIVCLEANEVQGCVWLRRDTKNSTESHHREQFCEEPAKRWHEPAPRDRCTSTDPASVGRAPRLSACAAPVPALLAEGGS